jgi:hypothetical protein
VLTNADLVETILNLDMLPITKQRLNTLTLGQYDNLLQADFLFDYHTARHFYHSALNSDYDNITNSFNVDYVLIEADYNLHGHTPVFTNGKFKIYKVN